MTSWMIPTGDAPYAAGNQATCDAQGFFVSLQFIYFVTAYTLLAVLYWLIVERSWKDNYMKRTAIRLLFLLPPVVISLVFAVVPLFYEYYNVAIVFCYLNRYPPGCVGDECIRGTGANNFQTAQFGYTMACNIIIIIFMILLVRYVRKQEATIDKYAGGTLRNRKQTNKAYWQGFRYIGGFTLSYIWIYVFMIWNIAGESRGIGFVVLFYFHVLLNPLAGFFNAYVYFRPRYDCHREQHPTVSRMDCICHVLDIGIQWCHHINECCRKHNQLSPEEAALISPEELS